MDDIKNGKSEQVVLNEGELPVLSESAKKAVISLFEGKKNSEKTVDEILTELDPPLGEASFEDLQVHWLNFQKNNFLALSAIEDQKNNFLALSAIEDQMLVVNGSKLSTVSYETLCMYRNFSTEGGKRREAIENQMLVVFPQKGPNATYKELQKFWEKSTKGGKLREAIEDQMLVVDGSKLSTVSYKTLFTYRIFSTEGGKRREAIEQQLFDLASSPELITDGKTFSEKDIVEIANDIKDKNIINKKITNAFRDSFETLYNRIKGEESST